MPPVIMKRIPFHKIFLALILISGGACDWIQYLTLKACRADASSSAHKRADLLRGIEKAKQYRAVIESARSELKVSMLALKSAKLKTDTTSGTIRPDWASSPEAESLRTIVRRGKMEAEIDQQYGPLFKELGLPPEQLSQLKALLLERKQAAVAALAVAQQQQGLTLKEAWANGLIPNAITPVDIKIQQMLSGTDFADFNEYEQTLGVQETVNQLGKSFKASGVPLTPDQADTLRETMINLESPAQLQNQVRMNTVATLQAPISPADIMAASTILLPAQVAIMKQSRQQSLRNGQLSNRLQP
jgi:hypothetical protein